MAAYAGLTMARAETMNQGEGNRARDDYTESKEEADARIRQEQEQMMSRAEKISENIIQKDMTEALVGRETTNSMTAEVLRTAKDILKEATEAGRLHIIYYIGSQRREGYAIIMESHKGRKENCTTCASRQNMMEELALKIHEEADKQIRGKGMERKEQLFEGQITWWEERKEEAREFLERQTQAGTMHKTQRKNREAKSVEYHRGRELDCDRCAKKRRTQEKEKEELIKEEERQREEDMEKRQEDATEKGKGKQKEQLKGDRERKGKQNQKQGEAEKEEDDEGRTEKQWIRNPHGEGEGQIDFARASTSGSEESNKEEERESEQKETESEDEEDDGECLGCGGYQRANTQCLYCGAPVEPRDGSGHYMFGWHEGSRRDCADPRCREWIEREDADEERRRERGNDHI
jgi:hypothetical protein